MQQGVKLKLNVLFFKLSKILKISYWRIRDVFKVIWITLLLAFIRGWKTPARTHRKIRRGEKLRICVVSEYYFPVLGGITEHVYNTIKNFIQQGHEVTLLTSNAGDPGARGKIEGLRIVRVGKSREIYSNGSIARMTFSWTLHKEVEKFFAQNEFDVVHIHSPLTPSLPLLVQKYIRCPVVGTYHTDFDKSAALKFWQKLAQHQIDRIDAIIAVSPVALKAMQRYVNTDGKERIIPNGVDTKWFYKRSQKLPQLDDGRPNILYTGRFDPRNGFTTVVKAFAIVKNVIKNARLVVIGYGPLQKSYMSSIPPDIQKDILFVGKTDLERPQYLSSCDVMCIPTKKATCSLILLEAFATKIPVVASPIPAFKHIVKHKEEIYFTKDFSPFSYAEGILEILTNKDLREKISESALQKALSMDWKIIAEKILETYYDVLHAEEEKEFDRKEVTFYRHVQL